MYKIELHHFLLQYFSILKTLFHTNPTIRKDVFKKVENFYCIKDDKNPKIGDKEFFNLDKHPFLDMTTRMLFVIGQRGYGKTALQNCWLMKYSNELNEKDFSWIRVDVSKIYFFWEDLSFISFEKYLQTQLVYVFAKYYKNDLFFEQIYNKHISNKTSNEIIFKTYLDDINRKITEIENKYSDVDFRKLKIKKILAYNFYEKVDFLYQKILNTKIKDFYAKDRILLFIDGIDNIDYNLSWMNNIISGLIQYAHKDLIFGKIIVFLRDKFFYEHYFRKKFYQGNEKYLYIQNIAFEKILNNIKNILNTYRNFNITQEDIVLENINKNFVKKGKIQFKQKRIFYDFKNLSFRNDKINVDSLLKIIIYRLKENNELDDFEYLLEHYSDLIKDSLIYKGVLEKKEKFDLNNFFHKNYRDLFIALVNSYIYIKIFMETKKVTDSFKDFFKNENKKLFIMEALFKNGYIYGVNKRHISYHIYHSNILFLNLLNIDFSNKSDIGIDTILFLFSKYKKNYELEKYISQSNLLAIENKLFEYDYYDKNNNKLTYKGKKVFLYYFRDINVFSSAIFNYSFYTQKYKSLYISIGKYQPTWEEYSKYVISYIVLLIKDIFDALDEKLEKCDEKSQRIDELKQFLLNPYLIEDIEYYFQFAKNLLRDEIKDFIINDIFNYKSYMTNIAIYEKTDLKEYLKKFNEYCKNNNLENNLCKQIKYVFLFVFKQVVSTKKILENVDYHYFIFGDIVSSMDEKFNERKEFLEKINLNDNVIKNHIEMILNNIETKGVNNEKNTTHS